jgi:type II secretory pathway pseudopilin PulG
MSERTQNRGLTLLEVLVLIVLFASILALVISGIQRSRESARAIACADNFRRLGLACHDYHDNHRQLPSSSGVTRNPDGTISAVDGWSWIVQVLPYLEKNRQGNPGHAQSLSRGLDIAHGRPLIEPAGQEGTPHAEALATRLPELLCSSFRGSPFADATATAAITNYKAMGATHIESLSVASAGPATPKYNPAGKGKDGLPQHPDGACFPGTNLQFRSFMDGTANTILLTETVEPRFARWTVGSEAAVVGLPRSVEYEYSWGCYTAKGLKGLSEDGHGANPCYWTYHTYLDWDYAANPYDGADGTLEGAFGPSSHHPKVVNHLFADGSLRILRRRIDVSVYMRLITRCGDR